VTTYLLLNYAESLMRRDINHFGNSFPLVTLNTDL